MGEHFDMVASILFAFSNFDFGSPRLYFGGTIKSERYPIWGSNDLILKSRSSEPHFDYLHDLILYPKHHYKASFWLKGQRISWLYNEDFWIWPRFLTAYKMSNLFDSNWRRPTKWHPPYLTEIKVKAIGTSLDNHYPSPNHSALPRSMAVHDRFHYIWLASINQSTME